MDLGSSCSVPGGRRGLTWAIRDKLPKTGQGLEALVSCAFYLAIHSIAVLSIKFRSRTWLSILQLGQLVPSPKLGLRFLSDGSWLHGHEEHRHEERVCCVLPELLKLVEIPTVVYTGAKESNSLSHGPRRHPSMRRIQSGLPTSNSGNVNT